MRGQQLTMVLNHMGWSLLSLGRIKHYPGKNWKNLRSCIGIGEILVNIPASSKGCCLNPKGWCIGTPYHPFSTPWKIQVDVSLPERTPPWFCFVAAIYGSMRSLDVTFGDGLESLSNGNGCHLLIRRNLSWGNSGHVSPVYTGYKGALYIYI